MLIFPCLPIHYSTFGVIILTCGLKFVLIIQKCGGLSPA